MEYSSFFNAIYDSQGKPDRNYKAEDFDRHFKGLFTDGVFPNPAGNLQVTADGSRMSVVLGSGPAWIQDKHYFNDSPLPLTIDTADAGAARIDRVIIRLDYDNRKIYAAVKKGTYSQAPAAPALQRDADAYELGIADIAVTAGTGAVTQSMITDLRLSTDLCGVVNFCNPFDTTAIFNQMQAWFNEQKGNMTAQEQTWVQSFTDWFTAMKGQLSTDAAGNLQQEIDDIQIGGRNLMNTAVAPEAGNASGNDLTITPYTYNGIQGYRLRKTANASWGSFLKWPIIGQHVDDVTSHYSFSVYAVNLDPSLSASVNKFFANDATANILINSGEKAISTAQRYKFENLPVAASYNASANNTTWHMSITSACDIFIAHPQLEIGTKCTDYRSAPEDTQSQIDNIVSGATAVGNASKLDNKSSADFVAASGGTIQDYSEALTSIASATGTVALSGSNNYDVTLTGDVTFTLPSPAAGKAYSLTIIIHESNPASFVTWPSSVKWPSGSAPTLVASTVCIVTLLTIDGGTTWRASAITNYAG